MQNNGNLMLITKSITLININGILANLETNLESHIIINEIYLFNFKSSYIS